MHDTQSLGLFCVIKTSVITGPPTHSVGGKKGRLSQICVVV